LIVQDVPLPLDKFQEDNKPTFAVIFQFRLLSSLKII